MVGSNVFVGELLVFGWRGDLLLLGDLFESDWDIESAERDSSCFFDFLAVSGCIPDLNFFRVYVDCLLTMLDF